MNKLVPNLRFLQFAEESEWEEKKLGEVATFTKGKGISKSDIVENGANECIRYGELYTIYGETIQEIKSRTNLETKNLVLSEFNDVIIPASGETQIDISKAACVLKKGVILGGDLNIIKTKHNGVFLSYYLNSKKKQSIAVLAQGISVVHLYASQLAILSLNFPSLAEQTQIGNFLTAVDTRILLLKQKLEQLKSYKKGIMAQIFSQELRFKDENGQEFPEWEEKTLGEVFDCVKGQGLSKNKLSDLGKYKCILYGELYTTYKQIIFNVKSKTNFAEGTKSQVGDLLMPTSTTTSNLDIATATALNEENVLLGGDISVLRHKGNASNVFYAYYLSFFKKQEIANYAQGTTIIHLYFSHIKEMPISIPCLAEQTKIAEFLTAIDKKINLTEQQIVQSEEWKKGLLQAMLV